MFRPSSLRVAIILSVTLAAATLSTAAPPAPANHWIPKDAIITLEVTNPGAVIDFATGKKATAAVTATPLWKQVEANPKFQELRNVITFLEISLETDWRTALAKLTGGGVTFAVCPRDTVILIVDSEDEKMLNRVHELFLGFARNDAQNAGDPERVASTKYDDVTAWTFNGSESHAIIGSRFVLSNRPEGLKTVLDLRKQGENLTANTLYQAACKAAPKDSIARAFVDVKPILAIPGVAGALKQQDSNPLVSLLLAGVIEAVKDSNWLSMGLSIKDKSEDARLILDAALDGDVKNPNVAAFALPKPGGGVPRPLQTPGMIATGSFYRDLHKFYAAKDDLFGERTSGLIFFENMMGIFFTGRDLTNEVLAETYPDIRIVVAQQRYDPNIGTPQLQLPGFAVIFRLREPEHFKPILEEAWQKAIGLVNFTRGQQALPGLIIDRPVHSGVKMTTTCFSAAEEPDKTSLPNRFNIRPTLAMPGQYAVLSSTDALAMDLIDLLKDERPRPDLLTDVHSVVELDAAALRSILTANRQALVHSNMLKKGSSQSEAEASVDMLLGAMGILRDAGLGLGVDSGLTKARLQVRLNFE